MNEKWNENPQPEDLESKLTLYLMGEADADTRAEVEQALQESESLRARRDEMQRALDLLRAPQLQPVLDQERRASLRAAALREQGTEAAPAPAGKLFVFPGMRMVAALLIFGGMAAIWTKPWEADLAPEQSQVASAPAEKPGQKEGRMGGRPSTGIELGYNGGGNAPAEEIEEELEVGDLLVDGKQAADDSKPALGRAEAGLVESLAAQVPVRDLGDLDPPSLEEVQLDAVDLEMAGLMALGYSDGSGGGGGFVLPQPTPGDQPALIGGQYVGPGDSVPSSRGTAELGAKVLAVTDPTGGGAQPLPTEEVWRRTHEQKAPTSASPSVPSTPATPGSPSTPATPPAASNAPATGGLASSAERPRVQDKGLPGRADGKDARGRFADDRAKEDAAGRLAYDAFVPPATPQCTVSDGYGRVYHDTAVLEYLRPAHGQETPRDMFFRFYGDNPEVFTQVDPMSTFAADVDTASYPMARNYLVNRQLPPKAAIRTEEFLNYFDYYIDAPKEDDFAVQLQAASSPFGDDGDLLLSIGIKAREVDAAERKPMNLVFVIDKSGSMDGARIQLVKDALMLLVDQIRDTDTIGLVTFDSSGHVVLDPTPGRERYRIREAIRGLHTGGSTNAGEGIFLGYGMIEKVFDPEAINRVVLASDGVANTGETDQAKILKTVLARAEAEVDLTTLGVGMGNHNDVFLEQLADQGNGSCHYLDDLEEAKRVLVEGFLGTMVTVARDVKIQVEFDSGQVLRWRQLGYENRSLAHADFRKDDVDAGEVGSGHEVVALYELQPHLEADAEGEMVTVRLRWKPDGSDAAVERSFTLDMSAAEGRTGLASVRLRQMAVVAQYAEVLRRSWHARLDSYDELLEQARGLAQELSGEAEVVELARMIERTRAIAQWTAPQDELSLLLEEARRQRLLEAEFQMVGLREGGSETEELLQELRRQNELLENRLQEMLQRD